MKTSKTRGEFIRYGNLSSQYHKIIPKERSYHTPPVEKGFYAFPKGFIEPFLIGGAGAGSLQNGRYSKFKNKEGKVYRIRGCDFEDFKKRFSKDISNRLMIPFYYEDWLELHEADDLGYEDYEIELNEGIWEIIIENKPTRFTYGGLIWHHLFNSETPQLDKEFPNYIKIIDSWVLTDMPTYLRCLKAEYGKGKWQSQFKDYYGSKENDGKPNHIKKSPGFNYGGSKYYYSKDHFEVYIESIQNE